MLRDLVIEQLVQDACEKHGIDYAPPEANAEDVEWIREDAKMFLAKAQQLGILKNVDG